MSHSIEKLVRTPKGEKENSFINLSNLLRPFLQSYFSLRRTSPPSLSLAAKKIKT
jgi:hypothetical protein